MYASGHSLPTPWPESVISFAVFFNILFVFLTHMVFFSPSLLLIWSTLSGQTYFTESSFPDAQPITFRTQNYVNSIYCVYKDWCKAMFYSSSMSNHFGKMLTWKTTFPTGSGSCLRWAFSLLLLLMLLRSQSWQLINYSDALVFWYNTKGCFVVIGIILDILISTISFNTRWSWSRLMTSTQSGTKSTLMFRQLLSEPPITIPWSL